MIDLKYVFSGMILLLFLGLLLPSFTSNFQLTDTSTWNTTERLTTQALYAVPLLLMVVAGVYFVYRIYGEESE